ncbi:hypothetical protein HK098_002449 [Nowakowskiella sp. JEL0407]|nr:hypothetical protein HK098_002449 [Nowakowskiella sp. JEL0407]
MISFLKIFVGISALFAVCAFAAPQKFDNAEAAKYAISALERNPNWNVVCVKSVDWTFSLVTSVARLVATRAAVESVNSDAISNTEKEVTARIIPAEGI